MAQTLDEVYEAVGDRLESTNTIARRLRSNWAVVFGQLCQLEARGKVIMETTKSGRNNTNGWRRKQRDD